MKPLAGLRVLDLTRVMAGPFCTALLADLGAGVMQRKPPHGDACRRIGRPDGPVQQPDIALDRAATRRALETGRIERGAMCFGRAQTAPDSANNRGIPLHRLVAGQQPMPPPSTGRYGERPADRSPAPIRDAVDPNRRDAQIRAAEMARRAIYAALQRAGSTAEFPRQRLARDRRCMRDSEGIPRLRRTIIAAPLLT